MRRVGTPALPPIRLDKRNGGVVLEAHLALPVSDGANLQAEECGYRICFTQ